MLRCNMHMRIARAASHTLTELMQISGPCNLVYLNATNSCIIYNHKVTNFTTICGIYGLKTVKIAQNPKFRFSENFYRKMVLKS